jgi:hypothetical protein
MKKVTKEAILERWERERLWWEGDEKRAQRINDVALEERCRARVLIYESCIRDLKELL